MLPLDMARIAIRVLGQCQKHGALLADDIAKWVAVGGGGGAELMR